jgi:transcriptional regulator with XRE-family HTH domain
MPQHRRDTPRDALIRYFGIELRAEREAAGLSQQQLAEALGCTHQWIGKVERGESAPSDEFSTDLETYFKAGGRYNRLRKEIKDAHRNQVLLPGFPDYIELEKRSVRMRYFSAQLIPGLLQTEGYTRGVISAGQAPAALEEMVSSRLDRQTLLSQENPLSAWFVIDESALRRPVGGPEVMRRQLEWLLKVAELSNVRLWIFPFSSVTYAAFDGSFLILSLHDGGEVLYTEGPGLSHVIDDPDTVADSALRFDLVMGEALRSNDSLTLIRRALEDFS